MTAHGPALRTYYAVYLALMVLLAATVVIAFIPLGPLNVAIVLLIAFTKAVLIALYFMHVRYSSPLVWGAAGGTLLWLAILFGITMSDYATRGMWTAPPDLLNHESATGRKVENMRKTRPSDDACPRSLCSSCRRGSDLFLTFEKTSSHSLYYAAVARGGASKGSSRSHR